MREDQETQDMGGPVPILIVGDNRPKPGRDQIVTDGFTLALTAADAPGARQLLPEDSLRTVAWIQTDTICFVGTKSQMTSINALINNASPGPGARILNVSPFVAIRGSNELWVAFSAAPTIIGVLVERRSPGGAIV